jgi:hypothetical protein
MDVWEFPCSSCSGLDRGFLMDVGPKHPTGNENPWGGRKTSCQPATQQMVAHSNCDIVADRGFRLVFDNLVDVVVDC